MRSLESQTWNTLVDGFRKFGFTVVEPSRGTTVKMTKAGVDKPIIFPKVDRVQVDVIKANLENAGISEIDFLDVLKGRRPPKTRDPDIDLN